MCISKFDDRGKCNNMDRNDIGHIITGVLSQAKSERRLICGLLPSVSYLEQNPDDVLVCLLPETRSGDAAAHMHVVLLQAFCLENDVPVIMVDSSERLGELCGAETSGTCAIISRDPNVPWDAHDEPPLSPEEKTLQDFYECTLEQFPRPVIELPI